MHLIYDIFAKYHKDSCAKKLGKATAEASDHAHYRLFVIGIRNSKSHGLFWFFEWNKLY